MMFCDTLARVSMRRCFKLPSLISKFGSQLCLGVVSFQFMHIFDQNFVVLAEHHYLQTPSDASTFRFCCCYLKENKVSRSKGIRKVE